MNSQNPARRRGQQALKDLPTRFFGVFVGGSFRARSSRILEIVGEYV